MNALYKIATLMMLVTLGTIGGSRGQTVSDYDGNVYQAVTIGQQVWLTENLRSLHYSDGTPIPDVKAYNNAQDHASVYGRLYTWDAAMNGSVKEKAQGACPDGWHVPSGSEWALLANHLGGVKVAGGKLKEKGTEHWNAPNTGATNASGFTALPSGEYDTEKGIFQLMNDYSVIWSSTGGTGAWAKYFYLAYDDGELHENFYDKTFYYSVRCIRDEATGVGEQTFRGLLIYPNPFDHLLHIDKSAGKGERESNIQVYNQSGQLMTSFFMSNCPHQENLQFLPAGIYYIRINSANENIVYKKVIKK